MQAKTRKHAISVWLCAVIMIAFMAACSSTSESNTDSANASPQVLTNSTATEASIMSTQEASPSPTLAPFEMTIEAFERGAVIPAEFACTGENISPAISWNEPPVGTNSFALLFDDPDAPGGSWVHWILYNIPAEARGFPASMPSAKEHANGTLGGANSWGETAYGGPCPPQGSTHEYLFIVYALDTKLALEAGARKAELLAAIEGHVLTESSYTGIFSR